MIDSLQQVQCGPDLLNRYTGQNLYRGFESLSLRQNPSTRLSITTYRSPLLPLNYMIRGVRRGIWCMFVACLHGRVLQRAHGVDCLGLLEEPFRTTPICI